MRREFTFQEASEKDGAVVMGPCAGETNTDPRPRFDAGRGSVYVLVMDIVSTGRQLLAQVKQRAQALEEDLKARREVEVAGMVAGIRARLEGRTALTPLPVD